jgi:hypothetical protein
MGMALRRMSRFYLAEQVDMIPDPFPYSAPYAHLCHAIGCKYNTVEKAVDVSGDLPAFVRRVVLRRHAFSIRRGADYFTVYA